MQITSSNYYMNAYAANASYQNANFSMSGSYFELTGGMSFANSTDGVDLSDKAKELADRAKNLDIFKIIFPNNDVRKNAKSLDDVEKDFNADFANFANAFSGFGSMLGLSGSAFTMGLNGTGGVTATGGEGDLGEKLQNALNNGSASSQTMVARFAVMAARAALVDAGNTVPGFKDAYANDPFSAIPENIDALKERLLGFRVTADNGAMNYGFVRSFSMQIQYSSLTANYSTGKADDAKAEPAADNAETEAEIAAEVA